MPAASLQPRFRGLRLAVFDVNAAAPVLQTLLGDPTSLHAAQAPRFLLDEQWIELRHAPHSTLELHCDALDTQRTHLHRLGIETLDGSTLGCTPCLRLDAMETGACMVDLRESNPADAPDPNSLARLCGLTLAVRAPERVALHWAQLFHAPALRAADGLPALALGRLTLRFALARDGLGNVTALDFATPHRHAHDAAFDALGIAFRLRPDQPAACDG